MTILHDAMRSKYYCKHTNEPEYTPLLANNGIDEIGRLCLACGTTREIHEAARAKALMEIYKASETAFIRG